MKLESINCNHCGAPLEVAENARFVTCRHCDTQLAIKRTKSAAFTEEIERLSNTTDRLSDQLAQIAYQNEVERIDREWEKELAKFTWRDSRGAIHVPSKPLAKSWIFAGGISGGVVLFASVLGLVSGQEDFLVGIAIACGLMIVGTLLTAVMMPRALAYEAAKNHYEAKRAKLSPEQFRGTSTSDLKEEAGAKE